MWCVCVYKKGEDYLVTETYRIDDSSESYQTYKNVNRRIKQITVLQGTVSLHTGLSARPSGPKVGSRESTGQGLRHVSVVERSGEVLIRPTTPLYHDGVCILDLLV